MFTRRRLLATTGLAVLAAGITPSVPANARNATMEIKRSGSRPSGKDLPNISPAACASIR
jgi:hypothetical protein